MATYRVWDPCGTDEDDAAEIVGAVDVEDAAQDYMDKHYADADYNANSNGIELYARAEDGGMFVVNVAIEYEPVFTASSATLLIGPVRR